MTPGTLDLLAVRTLFAAPVLALLAGYFLFGGRWSRRAHWPPLLSCAAVAASALWLAWQVRHGLVIDSTAWRWLSAGSFSVDFGVRIDGLSASVLAMVSVVGALIHVYAVGYMQGDEGYARFFLYFHFFLLSMVGLLVSNSYLQMYLFWEGVGLASFLLIGFWSHKESARRAAWKAFLVNRIGDVGFMLAVLLLLRALGTTRFEEVFARVGELSPALALAVAGLLFWGASAKSAQFPLHVWLPDAMEGPTPVSALMHAATMVTAGVFLMARSMPLLSRAPAVMTAMVVVGLATALGAAVVAATRRDLKRILAYSTVSQLGFMMTALGTGNLFGAVFHLITHGFFKALLFLCAGSVIHALHDDLHGATSATVDDAGGLSRQIPVTTGAFLLGALALAGVPPLAGFFSKDCILEGAHAAGPVPFLLALCVAAGSAVYIFRMLFLVFFGERPEQRGPRSHGHEPGLRMKIPVLTLALCSAAAGALGGPVAAMLGVEAPVLDLAVSLKALTFAGFGFAAAWVLTTARPSFDWEWRRRRPGLERLVDSEFGCQTFTTALARAGGDFAAFLADAWERRRWDPFTEALGDTCAGLGEGLSAVARGRLNEYVWWMVLGAAVLASTVVVRTL
ncbi:MAG: NADH-quinone oxidoreductase subunit L [Elusimicrobiota bacterium]|jgi:NADH-quinone oxidoreductase subunit L